MTMKAHKPDLRYVDFAHVRLKGWRAKQPAPVIPIHGVVRWGKVTNRIKRARLNRTFDQAA